MEEAAILFAHGDMDGARTRLLEQLLCVHIALRSGEITVEGEKEEDWRP